MGQGEIVQMRDLRWYQRQGELGERFAFGYLGGEEDLAEPILIGCCALMT